MKHEFRYFLLLKCFFKNVGCECNSTVAQNREKSALSGQTGLVYRNTKLTFSLALFRRKFLLFHSNLRSLLKEGKKMRQALKKIFEMLPLWLSHRKHKKPPNPLKICNCLNMTVQGKFISVLLTEFTLQKVCRKKTKTCASHIRLEMLLNLL